jgi:hypothetical protein
MHWIYGITTVPERCELFDRTRASLHAAGFDSPFVFYDSDHIGCTGNWIRCLCELYSRDSHADRYAVFEDDVLACRNLREFLERCEWPPGYCNLFTFPERESRKLDGWFAAPFRGRGTQGLVFTRDQTVELLSARWMYLHQQQKDGRRGVDGAIHIALAEKGIKEYCHYPSLLQHIGGKSTLGHPMAARWVSRTWRGEEFDALELLKCPTG